MFVEHKEVGETKEAPAKTLKLSEAIRIGAKLRPQARVEWFIDEKSCALGAAYEALTGETFPPGGGLPLRVGELMCKKFPGFSELQREIGRRNDGGESRESIADWLESRGY